MALLRNTIRTAALPCWCLLLAAVSPAQAESAKALVSKGNQAYSGQRYQDALAAYEEASKAEQDSSHIWFNKGDALYQQGNFNGAMDAYEQAALYSKNRGFAARSKFNQGNASFREGIQQGQANPSQAIASLERGIRLYQDSLKLDPKLNDARHNIEVARRAIQLLREQMKNQPQQSEQNEESEDKQSGQDASSGQQQDQQQKQEGEQNEPQSSQDSAPNPQQQEQKAQAAEKPQDILNQERENKRRRQLQAAIAIRPVDKDW